jgi:hypothetical protein
MARAEKAMAMETKWEMAMVTKGVIARRSNGNGEEDDDGKQQR